MSTTDSIQATARSTWLGRVFAIDPRSLAIYRMALGAIIVWDILFRWPIVKEMYSDQGFFTRDLCGRFFQLKFGSGWDQVFWSFYFLDGSVEWATALFSVTVILGVMLVLGIWTRWVTPILFLLLVSLHYRNPLVLSSGDMFLRMQVFWAMFLPMGRIWSVDAWRAGRKVADHLAPVVSVASAGLILQLIAMYFFTGISKLNDVWFSGDAMWYVLRLDIYIRPFGRSLLAYPMLLKLVSWATLFIEVIWLLTLLVPWKNPFFRLSNLVLYWAFHIGIAMSMSIGLFPWISMIAWLPLIPAVCWGRVPTVPVRFRAWNELAFSGRLLRTLGIFIIGLVYLWNIGNIPHPATRALQPRLVEKLVYRLGFDQIFQMFDRPPDRNPWFVYEAVLADGSRVNLLTGEPVSYERPEWVRETFPGFHWRKLHRNLVSPHMESLRQPLARYWLERWNETHGQDQQVIRYRLICFLEKTGPDYDGKDLIRVVWGSMDRAKEKPGTLFDSLKGDELDIPF